MRSDIALKWRFHLEAFPPRGCLDASPSPLLLQMVITTLEKWLLGSHGTMGTTAPQLLHQSSVNNPTTPILPVKLHSSGRKYLPF